MTLNDAKESTRLVLKAQEGNSEERSRVNIEDNRVETAGKMTSDFHDLENGNHPTVSELQVISVLCTKCIVNDPETLVAAQGIIEDGTFSTATVVELTDQLVEVESTGETYE